MNAIITDISKQAADPHRHTSHTLGMLTDIQISGKIRIICNPKIRLIIHQYGCLFFSCTFSCTLLSFFQIFRIVSKILYINTSRSISKILAAGLESAAIRLHFRDFRLSTTPPFTIWSDFSPISVKSINRKRSHIGIRIFIRIIYYPINGYADSKLSILSIPTIHLVHKNVAVNLQLWQIFTELNDFRIT